VEINEWHLAKVSWIQDVRNPALKILCNTVASCLVSASKEALLLGKFASGIVTLPTNISTDRQTNIRIYTDRHLIIRALEEMLAAFEAFAVVKKDPTLHQIHIKEMVLVYLRYAFEMMLVLGLLCWDHQTDNLWFEEGYRVYLDETQLAGFKFDSESDYKGMHNDSTMTGVLADHRAVPATYLPMHPEPPFLIRDSGTYSRTIQINGRYHQSSKFIFLENCVFGGSLSDLRFV
jgi:hypothetical protein